MSSPNNHTSNIKDAFSSNFPNYIPASSDYVSASPGKTYSSSSNNLFGLVPIVSPTLSLFHDDLYMKVMHAYYAKELPNPPLVIMPQSPMLSTMFNSQEFFLPDELLPPKKHGCDRSSSSTLTLPQEFEIGEISQLPNPPPVIMPQSPMLSTMFNSQEFFLPDELLPPKKHGCDRSSSSTLTLPQEFEIGEISRKSGLECHEEQTKEILNQLDEISLDRIKNMEDNIEGLGKIG
nr:hypothetical protein [Tanacetum cinerariifolium]